MLMGWEEEEEGFGVCKCTLTLTCEVVNTGQPKQNLPCPPLCVYLSKLFN